MFVFKMIYNVYVSETILMLKRLNKKLCTSKNQVVKNLYDYIFYYKLFRGIICMSVSKSNGLLCLNLRQRLYIASNMYAFIFMLSLCLLNLPQVTYRL